jgi:IS30 family transposase
MAPEQLETIEKMRAAGRSYGQIAQRLGKSPGAVSWICLRHGIESPVPHGQRGMTRSRPFMRGDREVRPFSVEDDAQLLQLEACGTSTAEIARVLGRNPSAVTGRLMVLARRDARAEGRD